MTAHQTTSTPRRMARMATAALAMGVLALTAGCGETEVSDETRERGAQAVCASSDASIASLRAGGEGARTLASVIADVTNDQQVENAAKAVANGDNADEHIDSLTAWVDDRC